MCNVNTYLLTCSLTHSLTHLLTYLINDRLFDKSLLCKQETNAWRLRKKITFYLKFCNKKGYGVHVRGIVFKKDADLAGGHFEHQL